MRRFFLSLLALVLLASSAHAQQLVRLNASRVSDTLSSNGDSVTLTNYNLGGFGSVKVQTLDSYSGTWEVQCTTAGTVVSSTTLTGASFDTGAELKLMAWDGSSTVTSVTDSVGGWDVLNASGCVAITVIATAGFAASDTVVVISATQAGGGSGGGGGGSGGEVTSGVAANFLATVTDGAGALNVICDSGCSGGTTDTDDASIAAGQSVGLFGGLSMVYDGSVWRRLTIGTAGTASTQVLTVQGIASMTPLLATVTASNLDVQIGGSDTVAVTGAATPADNFANPTTAITVWSLNACFDGATWDRCPTSTGGAGAVDANTARVVLATDDLLTTTTKVDDAAFTPATSRVMVAGGQADDTSTDSVDEGDAGAFRISLDRLLYTRMADPCSGGATKLYLPFDITTATTTEITPSLAGASTHYYICAFNILSQGANSVNLVDDDSDNCASVTASLISSGLAATDGWYFAANGGMAMGSGNGSVMRTQTANSVLCLVTSAATELHGQFVVVAAP